MDENITFVDRENVLELGSMQTHVGFFSIFIVLLVSLILIATASFGVGYFLARSISSSKITNKATQISTLKDQKNGNSLFSDSADKFQVTLPTGWQASDKFSLPGANIFEKNQNSVEIWTVINQNLNLSKTLLSDLTKTGTSEVLINKEKTIGTEYTYKSGGILAIFTLAESAKHPKVTFWIKAPDIETYTTAKNIIQSFSFTN